MLVERAAGAAARQFDGGINHERCDGVRHRQLNVSSVPC